jgi:hypothetical protein
MKLVDIPVVFICPDHNEKYSSRKHHMFQLLEKIGFKNIQHHKSGNEAYPTCLAKATIDIMNQHLDDEPFILLEDDVEPFLELNSEIELGMPEDTDAFYLGFSKSGGHPNLNSHQGFCSVQPKSDTHIRILNMLSAHAILYKSKRYKEKIIEITEEIIDKIGYHTDVVISRIQADYNVYGYYYPLFYQSVKWGNVQHTEDYTRFKF